MKDLEEVSQKLQSSNADSGYTALKEGAAIVDLRASVLQLTGKDPIGMLNAILTNDLPKGSTTGTYAFLLNPKGRIQTDLRALKSGEDVLIVTEPEGFEAAREILGRYAPFSRVKLEDLSASHSILGLYGPQAKELLNGLELAEHETSEIQLGEETLLAVGVDRPVTGYDLLCPSNSLKTVHESLLENGATPAGRDAYETARIEAGVPRFGADVSVENFPGETGLLARTVNFQKGCYPGQETVARMHYRGHPNKTLHRLTIEGDTPAPGTEITQDGKQVGIVTSVVPMLVNGKVFALGYLSTKAELNAPLKAGGSAVFLDEARD